MRWLPLWLAVFGMALGLSDASAQETGLPHLERVRLTATLPAEAEAPVQVRVDYTVTLPDTTRTIPLRGLAFFDAVPTGFSAYADTLPLPLHLDTAEAPLLVGTLQRPPSLTQAATVAITVEYTIARPSQDTTFDLSIPVLFVDWLPRAAAQDFFVAEVNMPASHTLVETFPTAPSLEQAGDGGQRYRFSLQVLPSLVRLRGYIGDAPILTTARAIDLGVLIALVLIAAVSWRRLRRPSATQP